MLDLRRRRGQQDWQDVDVPDEYRVGPTLKDGEYVAKCYRCMDYGWVSVVSPKTLKDAWNYNPDKDEPRFIVGITSMPCYCERGQKLSENYRQEGKTVASLTPQAHEKHAIFFIDGKGGILEKSYDLLDANPAMDLIEARRIVLHRALKEFDAKKQAAKRFSFPGYES